MIMASRVCLVNDTDKQIWRAVSLVGQVTDRLDCTDNDSHMSIDLAKSTGSWPLTYVAGAVHLPVESNLC
jgi:hypothetical protein